MKLIVQYLFACCVLLFWGACGPMVKVEVQSLEKSPLEETCVGVVVPCNIAPLNFYTSADDGKEAVILACGEHRLTALSEAGGMIPSMGAWKHLLRVAKGKDITVKHCVLVDGKWKAYRPFMIRVAAEIIDPFLVYRLIPPGYEMWDAMGIYQRNLESFEETCLIRNSQTEGNCMNCHSFCQQNPDKMLFHVRSKHAGTILVNNGKITKIDTKTDQTISSLVYPYWHPSGKFITFSVNDTKQLFHTHNPNRVEVLDRQSDVVVYDVLKNELITAPQLFDKEVFETFPTFSPDGKRLYFCTAKLRIMPNEYDKVRYSLCSIAFDADSRSFGEKVDTLYNAEKEGGSVSFPRVSPDGNYLMFTKAAYGNFSIWHQDADLWMIDLKRHEKHALDEANSESVESYHSWSSNSRWVVFSSRRGDGLYTRLYLAYVDADGRIHKPFVLPQKSGDFYDKCMYSYNIPELVKGSVEVGNYRLVEQVREGSLQKVHAADGMKGR